MPPEAEAEAGSGLLRWVLAAIVLIALVFGAYRAYVSLIGDLASRQAATEAPSTAAPTDAPTNDDGSGQPAQPGTVANEPPAPAVAGGAVNKCAAGSQIIYTNTACPQGSSLIAADPADEAVPLAAQPATLSDNANNGQQQANCNFLTAEIARLSYEFQQPLPPAVLDHISSRLTGLRAQTEDARCAAALPKAASSAASAPDRRRAPAKGKKAVDQADGT